MLFNPTSAAYDVGLLIELKLPAEHIKEIHLGSILVKDSLILILLGSGNRLLRLNAAFMIVPFLFDVSRNLLQANDRVPHFTIRALHWFFHLEVLMPCHFLLDDTTAAILYLSRVVPLDNRNWLNGLLLLDVFSRIFPFLVTGFRSCILTA